MLPDFLFCSLFPVQQTTSGISHRVKQFFRVGNQYAECRNNDRENNAINDNDDRENREHSCLKKNHNAPRPSEHPPVWGKKCQNV